MKSESTFVTYTSTTSGLSIVTALYVCTLIMLQVPVVDRIMTLHLSYHCNTMAFPTRYTLTRLLATSRFSEHLNCLRHPTSVSLDCSSEGQTNGQFGRCVEVVKCVVAETFIGLDKWMAQGQVLEQQQNLSRDMTDLQKNVDILFSFLGII